MDPENDSKPRAGARAGLAGLAVLFVLPLALRLGPIRHGLPVTSYVPDTHVVRGALGMAKEKNLVPPAGKYSSYPNLLPYLLLPVYGAQYAVGRATGAWGGAGEFGMRLLEDPARAHLPARVLVALFGALTAWVVFRAARAMGLGVGAWAAAWLVATGHLHVHFSVQERPWVPMVFFLALASWAAAVHVRDGGAKSLLLSGACAGLAFATHQGGMVALGIPGLAWLFAPAGGVRQRVLRGVGCVALFAAIGVLIGNPALFVHGSTAPADVAGGAVDRGIEISGQQFFYRFRFASLTRLARAFFGNDPALVLLALGGLLAALRARAARPATIFALLWAAVFLTNFNDHVRYLLPLSVLLAFAAGFAAERLWARPTLRWALVPLLALPLVQSLRLGWILRQEDTRAVAAAKLAGIEGRIALDAYGPDVPLDRASLERVAEWRDLYAREDHRLQLLTAGVDAPPGLDAVRLTDLFDFEARKNTSSVKTGLEHLGDDPNAILRELGVTHVLLVDRDPEDGAPPFPVDDRPASGGLPKLPPLRIEAEPLWVVSPGRAREARLPTELDFPLVSLWRVERPGPRLALHQLEAAR